MKKIFENRFIFFIILITIIVIGAIIYSYFNIEKKPVIQVTPPSYDFGDIPQEVVSHVFKVENTGESTLEILRVSTSCGCTTASVESTTLAPNQFTNLTVTFDPNAMEEEIEDQILRIIYIKSNDPENPEVEIEITANVIKEL